MLHIKNLTKEYSAKETGILAIHNLSMSVKKGEFVSIIGPSGCGKTTVLKIVAGLLEPTRGTISFNRRRITKETMKDISIVFQNPVLLPWRNLAENVTLPQELNGEEKLNSILRNIELVGLKGFENSYPYELSGGMQQRLSIARALTLNPKMLLMDEPFGALDEMNRNKLNIELLRIWKKTKFTVLFITHSISEAVFLSDRVVILSKRPAQVKDVINIKLPRPRNLDLKESHRFQEHVKCIRKKIE